MLKTQIIYSVPGNLTVGAGEEQELTISTLTGEITDWTIFIQRDIASARLIQVQIEQVNKDNSLILGTSLGDLNEPISSNSIDLPTVGGVYRALGSVIKVKVKGAGNFASNAKETVKIQAYPSKVEGFVITKPNGFPLPTFATAVFCLESNQGMFLQDIADNFVAIVTEFNKWIPLPSNCYRVTTASGDDPVLIRVID
jgi:hypothetical protein